MGIDYINRDWDFITRYYNSTAGKRACILQAARAKDTLYTHYIFDGGIYVINAVHAIKHAVGTWHTTKHKTTLHSPIKFIK